MKKELWNKRRMRGEEGQKDRKSMNKAKRNKEKHEYIKQQQHK